MPIQLERRGLRFLVPSVFGSILALVAIILVAALSAHQVTSVRIDGGGAPTTHTFSIGFPIWYERTDIGAGPVSEIYWLNVLAFLAAVYLLCMPLGRLVSDSAKPVRTGPIFAAVVLAVVLVAVLTGGAISRAYWGYWFNRPSVDWRVANARQLNNLTPIKNFGQLSGNPPTIVQLPDFVLRSGGDWSDTSQLSGSRERGGYYTLHGRVLNALEDAGHSLSAAPQRTDAELAGLHALLAGTGQLDVGTGFYATRSAALTGYAVDLTGPRDEDQGLLLLTVTSGAVSNDHFAYYEFLFGPPAVPGDETTRPLLDVNKFYYDVAGLEGMEWYSIAVALGVLGLVVAMPLTGVVVAVVGTRRRQEGLRRGFEVEVD